MRFQIYPISFSDRKNLFHTIRNSLRPLVRCCLCLLIQLLQGFNSLYASENEFEQPLRVANVLPIAQGLGLPQTLATDIVSAGEQRIDMIVGIQSNANDAGSDSGETLIIDSETQSIDIGFEYGLSPNWQIDAQVSLLRHHQGYFDSVIRNWHQLFGLSDGDRQLFDKEQINVYYANGENNDFSLSEPVSGISDLRLGLAYQLPNKLLGGSLIRLGSTLPTGNSSKLTGSDRIDFDLGVYQYLRGKNKMQDFALHLNLGYVFIGDEQQAGINTKGGAWFSSLGAYWIASSKFTVQAQIDSHAALFDSDISELNQEAHLLSVGLSYNTNQGNRAVISFSEDLSVNRAADFSFSAGYQINLD